MRPSVLMAALLTACGAPAPAGRASIEAADHDGFPATDRDPLPYTPAPVSEGVTTAGTVALAASGGEDQARRMLPALIRAVRDADERQLESLFAEEVASVDNHPRGGGAQPRAPLVQRILVYARRSTLPPDATVEELVELSALEIHRAARYWAGRDMPEQVRATDLVVEVPIRDAGRVPLRTMLGWHLRGHLVVRPGRDPRIVAL